MSLDQTVEEWELLGYDRFRINGRGRVTCKLWKEDEAECLITTEGSTIHSAIARALAIARQELSGPLLQMHAKITEALELAKHEHEHFSGCNAIGGHGECNCAAAEINMKIDELIRKLPSLLKLPLRPSIESMCPCPYCLKCCCAWVVDYEGPCVNFDEFGRCQCERRDG